MIQNKRRGLTISSNECMNFQIPFNKHQISSFLSLPIAVYIITREYDY